jgi:predicted ferric reductase
MTKEQFSRAGAMLLYIVAVSLPILSFLLYGPINMGSEVEAAALLLIQASFPMFALQPLLAARLRILDRLFGLDNVYLFHKTMGMTAGTILLTAFVLLVYETGASSIRLWLAIPAIPSLIAVGLVIGALFQKQSGLSYERWRLLHNLGALIVIVMLYFQGLFLIGPFGKAGIVLWLLLLFAGGGFYINHKFTGPIRRRKNPFLLEDIQQETHNVWTLRFRPPEKKGRFDFLPGQFQFLTFMSPGLPSEEHPFTIASSPTEEGWHASTIKESGDFTSLIGNVTPGDPIAVQAPFGRFSYSLYPKEKDLVFIAGGIGITPLMSMLRHMRDSRADLKVLLLYSNRTEDDIVFRKELEEMSSVSLPGLRVVHVLSRAGESWSGERGRIDADFVKQHIGGSAGDKTFYVCGPPPMMAGLIAGIIKLGVPPSRVRSERFAL